MKYRLLIVMVLFSNYLFSQDTTFRSNGDTVITTMTLQTYSECQITIKPKVNTTDPDAQAFFDATGITDATIKDALNTLVVNAKSHGWWTKCNAIWPFAGGTSTTNKFNLKDPRDLDAAYRLTFSTGWTFAPTGIISDGATTTKAQTHLIPGSALTINDNHLSIYSRTSAAGSATSSDIGSLNSGTQDFRLVLRRSANQHYSINNGTATTITASTVADGSGYWMGSRTTSTSHSLYRNGVSIGTNGANNTNTQPSFEVYIGCVNFAGAINGPTAREYSFATIGSGITSSLALIMYNDIKQFLNL